MPQIVTDIRFVDAVRRATDPREITDVRAARAHRRRLAALRVRAPDTLRARVRRELRLAAATKRTD